MNADAGWRDASGMVDSNVTPSSVTGSSQSGALGRRSTSRSERRRDVGSADTHDRVNYVDHEGHVAVYLVMTYGSNDGHASGVAHDHMKSVVAVRCADSRV